MQAVWGGMRAGFEFANYNDCRNSDTFILASLGTFSKLVFTSFKGIELPKPYKDAIAEFKRKRAEIEPLAKSSTDSEWKRGSQMLADLAITKLVRELPVEAMYRLILNDQARKDKPLPFTYTSTAGRESDGSLVHVGSFDDTGAYVNRDRPRRSLRPSRRLVLPQLILEY